MPFPWVELIVILLLNLINGFFAMSEIALVSARKVRLQQKAEEGSWSAKTALELAVNPNQLLSTTQIGITLIAILNGAIGNEAFKQPLAALIARIPALAAPSGWLATTIIVLVTGYISLVIGELIPKRLGLNNPERIAMAAAGPMRVLSLLTAPLVWLLSRSTDLGLKILGSSKSKEPQVTEEELRVMVEQATQGGVIEEAEQDMVESVFRLGDRFVDALMTPRTELEWLDLSEPVDELLEKVKASHYNVFPVAENTLDAVQGVALARELLAAYLRGELKHVRDFIHPVPYVPESSNALKALESMRQSGSEAAMVIDEYGGLLGMVTPTDLLEAIVGEMPSTLEGDEPEIIQREDGTYLLDGLLPVDELKEFLGVDELPGEERVGFQTAGGFVMSQVGSIPAAGQCFEFADYRFEVVDMDGRRVDKILVTPLPGGDREIYRP